MQNITFANENITRTFNHDPVPYTINFHCGSDAPIIVISQEGFFYKGTLIEDAGEAYALFTEFLKEQNK